MAAEAELHRQACLQRGFWSQLTLRRRKDCCCVHLTPEDSNILYILSSCGCADCQQKRPPRAHLPAQILMAKLALAKPSCKNSTSSIERPAAKLRSNSGLAAAASANFCSTCGAMSFCHVGPRKDHASCEIDGSPAQSSENGLSYLSGSLPDTPATGLRSLDMSVPPHMRTQSET